MRRRLLALLFIALILSPVIFAAFAIRLPVLILEPGPAPDVARRSKIDAPTFPSKGSMHLTTAEVRRPAGATAAEVFRGLFDNNKEVVPRSAVYPPGQTSKQTESVQAAQMSQSELAAAAAALNELGMPYQPDGAFVNEVDPKSPAVKKLRPGDVITSVQAQPVMTLDDLTSATQHLKAGQVVALVVRRNAKTVALSFKTIPSPADRSQAALGATVSQSHRAPINVSISAKEIGGPSAGLMFALSIYDRLVPEDLTGGRIIAGTGTIDDSPGSGGKVGDVGAVDLKIKGAEKIGATVFLVPIQELAAARKAAGPSMKVIGVSSLTEAIAALKKLAAAA